MILVSGGCGYIGSHTLVDLMANGFDVISADNHIKSNPKILNGVEKISSKKVKNYNIDLCHKEAVFKLFEENPDIEGVIHFAALKSVSESVHMPLEYYRNNLNSLLNILDAVVHFKVPNLIFSSSCSVYGNADELPVTENTPRKEAESPYARTKQMGEDIMLDMAAIHKDNRFVLLRYFNPAGAHPSGLIGETPIDPPQNLVPIITETALGKRKSMTVFGHDYKTRDGSCIRDYIHVSDLANAHTKALQYLLANPKAPNYDIFNLGIGEGVSVLEAIEAFQKCSGKKLNYALGDRREGDVIAVYADSSKAEQVLGWKPKFSIHDIMRTAWKWEQDKEKLL